MLNQINGLNKNTISLGNDLYSSWWSLFLVVRSVEMFTGRGTFESVIRIDPINLKIDMAQCGTSAL